MKKIIFMGTPAYATCILKALLENKNFNIIALFTQPDKAVGRKQILTPSHTKAFLNNHSPNIPIFTPKSLKDEVIIKQIRDLKPDFIVVAAYGKILPKAILDIAPCVNLHASLLPKYRGASPIQSAILNGDEKSGICTMLMEEGLDTGPILESLECNIKNKNSSEVFEILANLAAKLIISTLLNFKNLIPKKQDENLATQCTKIKKEDGMIVLYNAKEIYQKYLAFNPWPNIFLNNGLKFLELELVDENKQFNQEGEILELEKESFLLSCKQGILRIKKLQESGKKVLDGRTYLNGKRLKVGDCLY
ncbi:methionyl-tRNA formyltransferase [Campylobacter sp. RM12910]|uniref:methionyl-tRNA formyltransferase n=1 Tax=Campylobacter molothri TaxID=1032242 RepID=UPI00301D8716|nr:methionyl-tRNA formyltransferase [Campylobacter sp. RM12910]MBZ7932971.1 methionyl-tRNA formyltransferase [Campylobacter sp. RM10543]